LALEVNRNLTWRDVQHLIVKSSDKINVDDSRWVTNSRGLKVHDYHGFGLLNAEKLVNMARDWKSVFPQHVCIGSNFGLNTLIKPIIPVIISYNTSACNETKYSCIKKLEHVKLVVTISSYPRGGLEIELISPSGTKSPILKQRSKDFGTSFSNWEFLSVFFWDEDPRGIWFVKITQKKSNPPYHSGKVFNLKLVFHGTCNDDELPSKDGDEKDKKNINDVEPEKSLDGFSIGAIIVAGLVISVFLLILLWKWKPHTIHPSNRQTSVGYLNNNNAAHSQQRCHHFSDSSFVE